MVMMLADLVIVETPALYARVWLHTVPGCPEELRLHGIYPSTKGLSGFVEAIEQASRYGGHYQVRKGQPIPTDSPKLGRGRQW